MKLSKDDYFNLVEDDIIYKAHKEQIDAFIKEALETEEKSEAGELMPENLFGENLPCPKEIEIPDAEYEQLKKHSEWLNTYEGCLLCGAAFETYRDKYEKEQKKNYKLRRIVERLMDDNVDGMREKIEIVLNILME